MDQGVVDDTGVNGVMCVKVPICSLPTKTSTNRVSRFVSFVSRIYYTIHEVAAVTD